MQTIAERSAASGRKAASLPVERDALYQEFRPLVQRLVSRYGVTEDLRQELPGEIYCRFSQLLNAYDATRGVPLRAYLVRMLSTSTYAFARSQWRRDRRQVSLDTLPAPPPEASGPDLAEAFTDEWARSQLQARLPEALTRLSARQRNIVVARFYEGRSFDEIAEKLQIRPVSVRSLLRYALLRLRGHLDLPETPLLR